MRAALFFVARRRKRRAALDMQVGFLSARGDPQKVRKQVKEWEK